ncbi:MAG: hypothetical protein ACFE0P_07075 [Oceanicaulis sp.]
MTRLCAVLTGDLIGSTKTERSVVELAFDALEEVGDIVRGSDAEGGAGLERFRGDGWQSLVFDPAFALRAALLFSAAVASVDRSIATRVAVGVGPVNGLHPAGLNSSDGPAFRVSGRLLENMPRGARLAVAMEGEADPATPWRSAAFGFAGAVAENWTQKQALVMRRLLERPAPTQSQVAALAGVKQQTVQQHFESAHGPLILDLLDQVEAG